MPPAIRNSSPSDKGVPARVPKLAFRLDETQIRCSMGGMPRAISQIIAICFQTTVKSEGRKRVHNFAFAKIFEIRISNFGESLNDSVISGASLGRMPWTICMFTPTFGNASKYFFILKPDW
jgi:hypothetical protein